MKKDDKELTLCASVEKLNERSRLYYNYRTIKNKMKQESLHGEWKKFQSEWYKTDDINKRKEIYKKYQKSLKNN